MIIMKDLYLQLKEELQYQMTDSKAKVDYYTNIGDYEASEKYAKAYAVLSNQLEEIEEIIRQKKTV